MTFVALTPLQVLALAISVSGVVVALYFLKVRRRRVFVSSALLWRRALEQQMSHSLWQRLRHLVSVILAIAISLLIALSLARPQIEWLTGKPQRIAIILDTSPSMNTGTRDGQTRWQHAVAEAKSIVDTANPASEFRIAETSGVAAFPFTPDRGEARTLIDQLSPKNVDPRFPVLDGDETQAYFISDGVGLDSIPPRVRSISVFETANNTGITAFGIRPIPSKPLEYEAYLEIDNSGGRSEIGLTLSGAGQDRITKTLFLLPGEKHKETFDLSNFQGGTIQASILGKDDALASDNVAFAQLPSKRKIRTLLVSRGDRHLETLLKLDGNVSLRQTDPAHFAEQPDVDAYIFDGFAPSSQPSKPALVLGAPSAAWLHSGHGVVQKPKVTGWSAAHPVMQHVAIHDISIERVARIDPSNLSVIAEASDTPLIVASENPKWVMLAFDLNSSDFPLQAGFPVFVHNVLAWFSDEQPGTHTANPVFFNVNASNLSGRFEGMMPGSRLHHELWFYMVILAAGLAGLEWLTYHRRITF